MSKILELKKISTNHLDDNSSWTAIIPAAGKGSRLNFDGPKILYPVLEKTILEHLVDLLHPLCAELIFVLSPEGKSKVKPILESKSNNSFKVEVQNEPTGMADAVRIGLEKVKTENSLVIWGDQIALNPKTVQACMAAHQENSTVKLTFPIIKRKNPYIHFERGVENKLVGVRHAREEDKMPETGENDCGLFLFDTKSLMEIMEKEDKNSQVIGSKTKEKNFLSFLPFFDRNQDSVITVNIDDPDETIGINTKEDAEIVGQILKKRLSNAKN